MNVYVMRHGTTIWNEKGRTQGRTNNRLSKSGIELTEKVAYENKDIPIEAIYCSPLFRTVQTANIMNKYHKVKVIKDDRITEIDQGIFAGRGKDDLTAEERKLKFSRDASCGMESFESVYQRAKVFAKDIIANCKHENILVVTHNCTATLLEVVLSDIEVDFNNEKHVRNFNNAQVKMFEVNR